MTSIEFDVSDRMAPLRNLYVVTMTYTFKVTKFMELYIYIYHIWKTIRASKNLSSMTYWYEGGYSPSNVVIANVVHRDLDLYF